MIQIVVGALLGGLTGVGMLVLSSKLRHRPITKGVLIGAFVGGALTGAIGASTFGLSMVASGGARAITYLSVEGATQGAVSQVTANVIDRKPMEGVGTTAAIGAVTAPAGYLFGKGVVGKVLPAGAKRSLQNGIDRMPAPIRGSIGGRLARFTGLKPPVGAPAPVVVPEPAPAGPATSGLSGAVPR